MTAIPGCENCGNDDGPHRYKDQDLCMDCLEELHPGDSATDVLAIDSQLVDPIYVSPHRLGGLT